MPNVLIRNLDPVVHEALQAKAQRRGQSLQQYLTDELTHLSQQLTVTEWLAKVDADADRVDLDPDVVIEAIHAGRERRQ